MVQEARGEILEGTVDIMFRAVISSPGDGEKKFNVEFCRLSPEKNRKCKVVLRSIDASENLGKWQDKALNHFFDIELSKTNQLLFQLDVTLLMTSIFARFGPGSALLVLFFLAFDFIDIIALPENATVVNRIPLESAQIISYDRNDETKEHSIVIRYESLVMAQSFLERLTGHFQQKSVSLGNIFTPKEIRQITMDEVIFRVTDGLLFRDAGFP